jgi:hypothetical protein
MSCRARTLIVGLLLAALTASLVQAFPLVPQSRPAQEVESSDLLTLAMDWLCSMAGIPHAPEARGTAGGRHGSKPIQTKIASQLDPDGHH